MTLLTAILVSFLNLTVPSDLLKAQKELYEAFETSSIDSVMKIPGSEIENLLLEAEKNNVFRVFVLEENSEKKADSMASNNLFLHFYFFQLAKTDQVKDEELQWIRDILASKGLRGSKHLGSYFYKISLQEASEEQQLVLLNLSRSFDQDEDVAKKIITILWKKRRFSELFPEILSYLYMLKNPWRLIQFVSSPLYFLAVFFLFFGFYIIICAFFKNAAYIWHAIYHFSRKFLRLELSSKFSSSLILASFFILAGKPFYLGSLLFGLSFPLMKKKEKVILTFTGIGAFLLSILSVEISATLRGYAVHSDEMAVYERIHCFEGGGNPSPGDSASAEEVFANAILCRRDRDFNSAQELYSRIADSFPREMILNNRGCLFFDMGLKDSAYQCFQSAWRIDSFEPAINYNLYVYHLKNFQRESSEYFKTTLERISPDFLEEKSFGRLSLLPTSEFLTVDIIPEIKPRYSELMSQKPVYDTKYSAFFVPGLKKTVFWILIFLALGFFLNFLAFRKISIEFCSLCGMPVCNLCKRNHKGTVLCSTCIARIEKLGKLADEKQLVNEISESLQNKRKKLFFAYSMLLPGFFHNLKGKGFRFDFAVLTALIVTLFYVIFVKSNGFEGSKPVIFIGAFALIYILFGLSSYLISKE
ncbi:hypothetical protein JXA84_01070 [candidate division WOR-3 bacterium]|nr:hypothetical protein [candidate division WOR-3 bacterium]